LITHGMLPFTFLVKSHLKYCNAYLISFYTIKK